MSTSNGSAYIESKVLTASQPQLHLILLEAAVRFGQRAAQLCGDASEELLRNDLLRRMMDVVEELTRSAAEGKTEISKQLEEQYAFVYRELAVCRFEDDEEKLASCLKLLEFQRETWKLACERLDQGVSPAAVTPSQHFQPAEQTVDSGFSLDA